MQASAGGGVELPGTKQVILAEDVEDSMMANAMRIARAAFARTLEPGEQSFEGIAANIRSQLVETYSGSWNCVVGAEFGAHVTHRTKTYMHFSVIPGVFILVWRV